MESFLSEAAAGAEAVVETMPDWLVATVILLVALAVALLVHEVVYRLLTRLAASRELFWRSLVSRASNPMRLAIVVTALALAAQATPLDERVSSIFRHGLLIGFIVILMWAAQLALHVFTTLHLRRYQLDTDDNLLARKHVTQTRILRRVASVLIVLVGLGAMLMSFEAVRQYGISLLASAGAAGIVVGLALQPLLKNLFAGIQLALTQPIRIDDALIVEGEYGNVEEITSTYVVVRTWDLRRLIIPLNYFMERPFQNWTREETELIGIVLLYVDFSVPVAALREKAEEITRAAPEWDGEVFALQVTDLRERVMEVRVLASAANSGDAFNLRCHIREQLIAFLVENYPHALPRLRTEMEGLAARDGQGDIHAAEPDANLKGANE